MRSDPLDNPSRRTTHFFAAPSEPTTTLPNPCVPNRDMGNEDSDTLVSGCGGPGFGTAGDGVSRESRTPRRRSCYGGHG